MRACGHAAPWGLGGATSSRDRRDQGATAGPGQFPPKGQYAARKRRVEAGSRGAQQRS